MPPVDAFIQDLAIIMLVAGVTAMLFNRFHQPVVLGYIVAGALIGPYILPVGLITDEHTVHILGELGVIFLLFSLGLEFSLKKLFKVGTTAFVAAISEIVLMAWVGFEIGRYFSWSRMDSIFLGAMLAVSSTTIIVKALGELGMKRERFSQLVFGILIVEDILAIGMIALLSGLSTKGAVDAGEIFSTIGRLVLFMTVSLVLGILIIPRLLEYVARVKSRELFLVTVLGFCFGFCLLAIKLGYSVALGAFIVGAIMAESRHLFQIERVIEPVRDMFSAVFFVTIGLLFNPAVLVDNWLPILVITVGLVVGKVVACTAGTFICGHDGRTATRVGMSLAQIGEFSFIIAALGLSLKVTSAFLYPTVVAVSAITTLLTPYLIRAADPLSARIGKLMPTRLKGPLDMYSQWLLNMQPSGDRAELSRIIRRIVLQVMVNLALVAAIFIAMAYFSESLSSVLDSWGVQDTAIQHALIWGASLMISLPFLIATYRKLQALSMLLAEIAVRPNAHDASSQAVRRIVSEVIPVASIIGIMLLIVVLSSSILPPTNLLILVLVTVAGLTVLLWRKLVHLHAKLQIALIDTLEQQPDEQH